MAKHLIFNSLALLALVACGGKADEKPPNAASAPKSSIQTTLPETASLKIYNWSDYVDPATVTAFDKKFQIKTSYSYYDSDESLEANVLSGKSGYDLVGPSNAFIGRQIKAGAYQKIDKSLIPNYKLVNPKLLEMMADIELANEYSVPFFWGTNTFAINEDKVKSALGTDTLPENQWDLVFNPKYTAKLKQCGISYLDSAAEMYPMALHYLGKSPNSNQAEDIDAATQLLKQNRTNIKRFTSSGFINDLARGDMCVTVGFGGDLNIARRMAQDTSTKIKIKVMMPKEGVGIWVVSFAIPADAKNVLNAHRYINYTLEPAVAAQNGNFVTYAPSSLPARELMEAQYRDDNTIFPTDEDLKNSFLMIPFETEMLKKMVRNWQNIKAGR